MDSHMSSDHRDETNTESHNHTKETVGALLHRERVTRRISVQRVAEDLKFNEEYLVAIEESRYKDLPAIPYVRVYIRTIAQYLSLDGEALLDRFAKEIQMEFPDPERERHDTMRISIQEEKKNNNWIGPLMVVIIIGIIMAYFIGTRSNRIEKGENIIADSTAVKDTVVDDSVGSLPIIKDTVPTDVVIPPVTEPVDTPLVDTVAKISVKEAAIDTTKVIEDTLINNGVAYPLDSLVLKITITDASSFVQVITNKRKVFNAELKAGEAKTFSSKEPIYVKVGRNSVVSYSLNERAIPIPGGWAVHSKFTRESGYRPSNRAEWNSSRQ